MTGTEIRQATGQTQSGTVCDVGGCATGERRTKRCKDAVGAAWQRHASRRGRRSAPVRRRQACILPLAARPTQKQPGVTPKACLARSLRA